MSGGFGVPADEVEAGEWLDRALRDHGYFDGEDEAEDEDISFEFWDAHFDSMIPARTTGTGSPMRAWEFFESTGRSIADYLAYLNRQCARANLRGMQGVDPRKLDDRQRALHYANLADAEALIAEINIGHPEEVADDPIRGSSTPPPSAN